MFSLICETQETKQTNKYNRNKLIDTENTLMVSRLGARVTGGMSENWEDI